jgi:phytoene dehydrogenase-like protein
MSAKATLSASVIGSGPNGLSAAIVLAAAGLATTVFERNAQIGGVFYRRDHTAGFPSGSRILCLPHGRR